MQLQQGPPDGQVPIVDCESTDAAQGPSAVDAFGALHRDTIVLGVHDSSRTQLNDGAIVHFIVIVAHAFGTKRPMVQ